MRKILFPIVVMLTIACTVGIYYLLFDKIDTLFYIATIVTCVSEVLLLMNIPIWTGEKMFNVTSVTISRSVNGYAIAIFLWTMLYVLAIHDLGSGTYTVYIVGMLIATLIFVVVCGASAIGADTAEKMSVEVQSTVDNRKNIVQFVRISAADVSNATKCDDTEWRDDVERLLRMITDNLASMPAEKLNSRPEIARHVEDSMTDIATTSEQLASAEDREALKAEITNKLSRLNKYITTIKTL